MTGSKWRPLRAAACFIGFSMMAVSAQSGVPKPSVDPDTSKDDILILVNLTAKELKFDKVPDPKVEFPGTGERSTVWVTDRFNLPDKVEPGVTYRNIGITLRISSRFADIDRIVREALGEDVPAPDAATVPTNADITQPAVEKKPLLPIAGRRRKGR